MFRQGKKGQSFFDSLCEGYYEKILRYVYSALGDESITRDCVQDVFLTAWQKRDLLQRHPNPGGFLFQTAKNLVRKARREGFQRILHDGRMDMAENEPADQNASIEAMLDRQINEQDYIEAVLSQLSGEKRRLYTLYYANGKSMAEIAALFDVKESAMRMRYVRLRREIRDIAARIAAQHFMF